MLGIDPLSLAFAAQLTAGSFTCTPQSIPKINITTTTDRIEYDFRYTQKQLGTMNIDTVSPYGRQAATVVGGLMSGEIEISSEIQLSWITDTKTRQNCFWYNDINITMHIDPTIYIAREHPRGTCEHDAVHEHEMKHIDVDRRLVAKYEKVIRDHLQKVTAQIPVYGPVAGNKTPQVRRELSQYIEKAIKQVTDKMYEERRYEQQKIDSFQEYERVRRQCE